MLLFHHHHRHRRSHSKPRTRKQMAASGVSCISKTEELQYQGSDGHCSHHIHQNGNFWLTLQLSTLPYPL
ncbi:hypothetical protein RB195_016408 [Necator americanus]|uniref:Uncharacterized protein n=1 Tax=Necator americanus TaxID=51031 RepID=A0ABR1E905_NECAM